MQPINDGDGQQALDTNQLIRQLQFSVKSGCTVSPGTNAMTVQVASGDAIFDGADVSVAAQDNVSLASADPDDPRKDVVYLDSNGTLRVATGTPEPAQPSDQIRRATYRPAPPDLSATDAIVLAEVWIPAGASDIVADDISDRRLLSDAAFRDVTADSLNTGSIDITDLLRASRTTETVSSGSIPYSAPFIQVNGEGASADDLEQVTGATNGDILILEAGDAEITIKDNAGVVDRFRLGPVGDYTLNQGADKIILVYSDASGVGSWNQIGRGDR